MPATNYHKFQELLTDPNEQVLNTLGNRAAEAFADTGKLKKSFAVLTNKRIYFKGKCVTRNKQGNARKVKSYTIELQDIIASSVVNTRSLVFHILAKLLTALAILVNLWEIYVLLSGAFREIMILNIFVPWLLALLFTVFDQFLSYRLFRVSFPGGYIALDLHWISTEEAEVFQKTLCQAREAQRTE